MPTFQYPELDLAEDSIRILRIEKGSLLNDIDCQLIVLSEREKWPDYSALSYTWSSLKHMPGGPSNLPRVWVNGHEFEVTQDLCSVLQYMRHQDNPVYLWVDAICINQENDREKGHQVRQMGNIYKTAQEVCIWLGSSSDGVKELMESISWANNEATQAQPLRNGQNWMDLYNSFLRQRLGTFQLQPHLRPGRALTDLLRRRWFTRVWVLQEVAMARTARIMCGPYSCPARAFALMPSLMGVEVNENTQAVLDIMPRLRSNTWWSSRRDLHHLLVKFAGSEATDKRDKIYALLGMSEDACNSARFYPSYEKSETQVFRDTACFLLLGEILDSSHSFPNFTLEDLHLPIIQLAKKTLAGSLGQSGEREGAQRTATLLTSRLNEGQLKTPALLLSLAKTHHEQGRVQELLSNGNISVSLDFQDNQDLLIIRSKEKNTESLALVFPRLESPTETRDEPPYPFARDENMTKTIRQLKEAGASNEELLRAYIWAGDANAVKNLLDAGTDINAVDNNGRTALVYAISRSQQQPV